MALYIVGMVLIVIALEVGIFLGYNEGRKDERRASEERRNNNVTN